MNYITHVLKNYATFTGRARRSEYWYFFLFIVICNVVLTIVGNMLGTGLLASIFGLAILVPGIAVAVRRMHDVGKPGWYCIIPLYNLILALTDGVKGSNEYGPDPKATDTAATV